jgi:hypothetical protein
MYTTVYATPSKLQRGRIYKLQTEVRYTTEFWCGTRAGGLLLALVGPPQPMD